MIEPQSLRTNVRAETAHLCACGCGRTVVDPARQAPPWNQYATRQCLARVNPNVAPLCACGCGRPVPARRDTGWAKYASRACYLRHNPGKPPRASHPWRRWIQR
mgnify:CR=1 FL=1